MHIKRIHEMEEKLTEIALCEINKGIECVNTAEMGAVIDMIKDLACAEKDAREAKEMEKEEEDEKEEEKHMLKMLKEDHGMSDDESKRFYDNYRYANGRFAPKGSGSYRPRKSGRRGRRGYEEIIPMDYIMDIEDYKAYPPEYWRDVDRLEGRMYYSNGGSSGGNIGGNSSGQSGSSNMSSGNMGGNSGGSSRGYEEYQRGYSEGRAEGYNQGRNDSNRNRNESRSERARRSYTETKEMNKDSSPESKQHRMKELDSYMNELNEDMKELIKDMTPEEKTMLKQKMAKLSTLV